MPVSTDWELRLEVADGLALSATLRNCGSVQRRILHNPNLQPSKLVLRNEAGKELVPFDERTRRKFDRTVRPAMFATIASGEKLELGRETLEKVGGTYQLRWGPFRYQDVPPGVWKVTALLQSEIRDGDSWRGTITSNEIKLSLP